MMRLGSKSRLKTTMPGKKLQPAFRRSVRHIAKGFDVTGWVRNLLDGRVEVQVNGEEDEVRAFLDGIAQSDLRALIRKRIENKLENPVATRGFEIRHE